MADPKAPEPTTNESSEPGPKQSIPAGGQLTDDDLSKVSGGSVSNVLKTRHDTAKNAISNVR